MRSWVSLILACLLGFFFIFAGQSKLTDQLTPDVHQVMITQSKNWYRVLQPLVPIPFTNDHLRLLIGVAECVFGGLVVVPFFRRWSAAFLAVIMIGAAYTHQQLNEPFIVPAVVLVLAITIILISGKKQTATTNKKKQ